MLLLCDIIQIQFKMKKITLCFLIAILFGCTVTKEGEKWRPHYRAQLGLNKGGITENTDFSNTPGIAVDAFSGATKTGFNASGHVLLPLRKNTIETGVDYMHNNQTFTFNDNANGYKGSRKIGSSQLMIPVTYNFGLLRRHNPYGDLQIRVGYLIQLNLFKVSNSGVTLTDYSLKHFSSGLVFGVSATPFHLSNGNSLGFYLDGYRGSKIYDDFYNSSVYEMPGSSFMKFGVIYQFSL
jgi:hypothetical protein